MFNEKLKHFLKHFLIYVMTLSFVTAFLVSCVHPVQASAISNTDEFIEAMTTEMERIQNAYEVGLRVGTIFPTIDSYTATAGIYSLMNSYDYYQMKYFDDIDNTSSSYTVPSDLHSVSGVYRTVANGDLYPCTVYSFSEREDNLFVSGVHFSVRVSITNSYSDWNVEPSFSYWGNPYTYNLGGSVSVPTSGGSYSYNLSIVDTSGYLRSYIRSVGRAGASCYGTILATTIPVISSGTALSGSFNFGGYGVSESLPSGEIEREEPWNYYNDELLPYIHNKYGDSDSVNSWLPWHGQPWIPGHVEPVDPSEPDRPNSVDIPSNLPAVPYIPGTPTEIPVEIDTNGTTELYEVYSPTTNQITINGVAFIIGAAGAFGAAGAAGAAGGIYANGQISIGGELFDIPSFDLPIDGFDVPISIPDSNTIQLGDLEFHFNSDGTITIGDMTFNLPLGEPETIEAGAETYLIEYELPTFETLYVPAETVPQISLSNYYDGITLLWDAVYDLLDNTGFLPLVYIMFGMGVVAYIMWKIGG